MRQVAAWLFMSLDGVVESPDKWQFEYFNEEMVAEVEAQAEAEDTMLLGRVTYQAFAPFWPNSTNEPYATHINTIPKYVVSTTLKEVEWGKWEKPTLIKGNLAEAIAGLKEMPGKNVGVGGSPTLVRSLLKEDLLDELKLMIHPVVVGKGKRLFTEERETKKLQLVDSKVTGTGVVILTYEPARDE